MLRVSRVPAFAGIADGLVQAMYEYENYREPVGAKGGRHWHLEPVREFGPGGLQVCMNVAPLLR